MKHLALARWSGAGIILVAAIDACGVIPATRVHHITITVAPSPTPTPTPVPTTVPTPAPSPVATPAETPIISVVIPAAPPPQEYVNHLAGPHGLSTSVTLYGDCSGQSELTHASASIDTCMGPETYFVGHNAGVFTPLLNYNVGDQISYWDGAGALHVLTVVNIENIPVAQMPSHYAEFQGYAAVFQTCLEAEANAPDDHILEAR